MIADVILLAIPVTWQDVINTIVTAFEIIAALIIFYGSARAIFDILASSIHRQPPEYNAVRREYTKKISLALEFFVANDLVKTILEPSLNQIIIVAFIVGIRTVVGWSLSRELKDLSEEGRPVQQARPVSSQ